MSTNSSITAPKLEALYEVSRTINTQLNLSKLLNEIMDRAIELLHAEKGLILFDDQTSDELSVQTVRAMDNHMIKHAVAMSRKAIEHVRKHRQSLLLENIPEIPEEDTSKSMLMYKIKSIVCVPLWSKEKLIGIIYLDTTNAEHFFTKDDMHFLEAFANLAAIAIDNAKTYQEIEELNHSLEVQVEKRTEELRQKNSALSQTNQELRETQLQLIHSEKMASLGQLVAGVAHEVNTPLGSLNSNMDMFMRSFEKIDQQLTSSETGGLSGIKKTVSVLEQLARTSKDACDRISYIIKALRNFARLDEVAYKPVDIHEGINSTLTLIEQQYRGRIQINKEFGELPQLYCQPAQLNQAFMNILKNACEAIEDTGVIGITTSASRDLIKVKISDSGTGIAEENLDKIFDPGFTTKGVGVGTGLSLSITYKIIEDHGGTISVKSEPGNGSTFELFLPLHRT